MAVRDDEAPGTAASQRTLHRVDGYARQHDWVGFPYAVVKKVGEDRAPYLAALVAYYGFFSLFPLLLVMVTVLQYLLADNPGLQERVVDSTLAQFPVIGEDISRNVGELDGNLFALVFGILAALWAGLGALRAMVYAMNTVWGVPTHERPNFIAARLRALLMLAVFGGAIIGITILGASSTAASGFGVVARVLTTSAAVGLAFAVFMLAFKVLPQPRLPWRVNLPGAILASFAFVALHMAGGLYVDRVVRGAQDTYGFFAVVIGLLSWMYLQAQIALVAAEVNVVRHKRLWPRSLPGGQPTDADLRILAPLSPDEQASLSRS